MSSLKKDPIRLKYYSKLDFIERHNDYIFYTTALLSCLLLFINVKEQNYLYCGIQVSFVILTIFYFLLGLTSKLKLATDAEDQRRADFLTKVFNVKLTSDTTKGYYNHSQVGPGKIIAAQTMENSFFSGLIIKLMLKKARIQIACYAILYVTIMLLNNSDLNVVLTITQLIFTEQILSRYIRMEWLSSKFDGIYSNFYALFTSNSTGVNFDAIAFQNYSRYEVIKAVGGITLSSSIFDKINPDTSKEWIKICKGLNI